jgi:hypothetical protein
LPSCDLKTNRNRCAVAGRIARISAGYPKGCLNNLNVELTII